MKFVTHNPSSLDVDNIKTHNHRLILISSRSLWLIRKLSFKNVFSARETKQNVTCTQRAGAKHERQTCHVCEFTPKIHNAPRVLLNLWGPAAEVPSFSKKTIQLFCFLKKGWCSVEGIFCHLCMRVLRSFSVQLCQKIRWGKSLSIVFLHITSLSKIYLNWLVPEK